MAEEHTETQEQKEAPEFTPITSQADLNRIVKDRLERERKKYADYGELKEQAGKYAELKESFDKKQSELAEALTRIGELEEARRVAAAKSEIAKEFSIPADALRGRMMLSCVSTQKPSRGCSLSGLRSMTYSLM